MPLERDTAQMLYGGEVVLHGGVPYVDAALNKGPLTYVIFAAIRLFSGRSEVAVRLTLALFAVAASLAMADYLRRRVSPAVGVLGGIGMALFAASAPFSGDDPNNLQYALAPVVASLWLTAIPGRRAALASGVLLAAAALINPACLALGPVIGLSLCWGAKDSRRRLVAAALGSLLVVIPMALWLGLSGALDDMLEQVPGTWHQAEIAGGPTLFNIPRLLDVPAPGLWLAALGGCCLAAITTPQRSRVALGAIAWILCWWARVKFGDYLVGDTEKPHHYYLALPGLVTGLTVGVAAMRPVDHLRRAAVAAPVMAVPLSVCVLLPQLSSLSIPATQRWGPGTSWSAAYVVASFVRTHTPGGSTLLAAGSDPEVNWLADRLAPTRFFDIFPINARPAYASERSDDLRQHPPDTVIAMSGAPVDLQLKALLDGGRYRLAAVINGSRVWLRQPAASPPTAF